MNKKSKRVGRGIPAERRTKKIEKSFFKKLVTNMKKFLNNLRRFIDKNSPTITRVLGIVEKITTIILMIYSAKG